MSRLNQGEREFVSDFGDLTPAGDAAAPAQPANFSEAGIHDLDARGISPPLPLLRAHQALRKMPAGVELRVITSYPDSLVEFQAMVKHLPEYELVSQDIVGEEYVHVLRRRR